MNGKNEEKPKEIEYEANAQGMVKLFVNVGKKDRVAVKDIIGSIANHTSISGKDIGKVILLDSYSFVEVPKEFVPEVMEGMHKQQIKGREAKFEISESK